ncbi:MAG: carboxymuconolactone decarboxylase family protein [Alphaproteobacteria bacterium]
MPLLSPIPPESVDGEVAEFYAAVTGMIGRVPNSVRTMAHAPFLAMLFLPFQVATQREWPGTHISGRLKELVVIKTSHINECEYCFAHNTALGEAAGITHDQVIALSSDDYRTSDLFDARERMALEWAEHMTRRTAGRDEALYARLRALFSDAEIVELTLICGLFNMINRINDSLGLEIEAKGEVDRIRSTLRVDPARMGDYLRWLADHWPAEFDTLNGKAAQAAAAE